MDDLSFEDLHCAPKKRKPAVGLRWYPLVTLLTLHWQGNERVQPTYQAYFTPRTGNHSTCCEKSTGVNPKLTFVVDRAPDGSGLSQFVDLAMRDPGQKGRMS